MSDFEQVEQGYHTEESTPEPTEAVETTENIEEQPQEQQETPSEPFLKVKYNKEERGLSQEEALSYAQKGMNYDKVQQQYQETQNYLNSLMEFTGFSNVNELMTALEEQKQQQRQQQFEQYGLDEESFQALIENSPLAEDLKFAREVRQQQQYQEHIRSQVDELIELFPDLNQNDIPSQVWEEAKNGRNLADAYLRYSHKNLRNSAEQSAIQKMQQAAQSSPGSLKNNAIEETKSIGQMSDKEFAALEKRLLAGERIIL